MCQSARTSGRALASTRALTYHTRVRVLFYDYYILFYSMLRVYMYVYVYTLFLYVYYRICICVSELGFSCTQRASHFHLCVAPGPRANAQNDDERRLMPYTYRTPSERVSHIFLFRFVSLFFFFAVFLSLYSFSSVILINVYIHSHSITVNRTRECIILYTDDMEANLIYLKLFWFYRRRA